MPLGKLLPIVCALSLSGLACKRNSQRLLPEGPTSGASARPRVPPPAPNLPEPTLLVSLPISAYSASLGLEGDVVFLLTPKGVFRLVAGQPSQALQLDLGNGPVLAESGIVYWSKGAIWNVSKESRTVRRVADLPHQPEYFVASDAGLAWLDAQNGTFSIQSLEGQKPRVLVSEKSEISAVHMIHEQVFFVHRVGNFSWQLGRVHLTGGDLRYTDPVTGTTPSMLAGTESVIFYDMGASAIRQFSPDLKSEQTWRKDFVCSPIAEAKNLFCSRVEGLFEIFAENYEPKVLLHGQHQPITYLKANAKQVAWIAEAGAEQLSVYTLPVE